MSEYENAKRVIRQMRLGRAEAQAVAAKAFEADLKVGRPDIALKCAKEFKLTDDHVTRAATALFGELIKRRMFPKALEIARSYNLAHGGPAAQELLAQAGDARVDDPAIAEIRRMARAACGARAVATEADRAIELLEAAKAARDQDPRVRGRAVLLPAEGEVWLTGDLHGNVDNLKRFAKLADLANHPERILVLQEIVHARFITADNKDLSFVAIMEAIRLMSEFPGRVYYLLGNHDLAVHLDRELVKGGKYLNRYLYRGMAYMYRERWEDVLGKYRAFVAGMPAAIFAPNGVFMAHSTPKKPFISTLSRDLLYDAGPKTPLRKLKPVAALVNGREYAKDAADAFADQMEVDLLLCGHTPTNRGWKVPNHRHLIIDSQHERARYVRFDLSRRYTSSVELSAQVGLLDPEGESVEVVGELM
ncbi:MAG: metallophosphoesterase [Planctomycetota bacterium]|nr:metallophosphoesterase [Planctomycetota bacterium]